MKARPILPPVAVALACIGVAAGRPAPAAAQRAGDLDAVDRYVRAELTRQRIPGASVAVLRGERVLLARGYGFANLEHRVPATDSTIYQSGSVGKQFTAALVLLLAREGRLGLDDPVRRYLPGPPAWDSITIRHLLTHTSGIPDYADSTLDYRRDYTEDQLVALAGGLPLEFEPGTHWAYSNTGYLLLGAIVRRTTGRFYGELLAERVFAPTGMRTARIISEQDLVPNRSDGYRLADGRIQHQEWVSPSLNTTADGSLYLSLRDLVRWSAALDRGPVPGRALLDSAWTPVRLREGGTYPYGFGWDLTEQRGHRRLGHGGSWQGFRSTIQRYPEFGLAVIVLANLAEAEPEAMAYAIAGMIEPKLAAAHLGDRSSGRGPAPPAPIPQLLRTVADGGSEGLTPRLGRFLLPSARRSVGELVQPGTEWSPAGCDRVGDRGMERLGDGIAWVCYARGVRGSAAHLVEIDYTGDWKAAFIDWYGY